MVHTPRTGTCAAGFLLTLLSACAHTRVTPFDPNADYPQRTPASEIRFYGASKPQCPYEEVGRLTAESRPFVSWSRVVEAARDAAHEMGGDAIINVQDGTHLAGATVSPTGVSIDEKSTLSGTVIRFRNSDCME